MSTPVEVDKQDLFRRAALEIQSRGGADFQLPVYLDLLSALSLVGNLQLALRHPGNTGSSSQVARSIINGLIARMHESGYHANAELATLGDNPEYDVAANGRTT